MVKIPPMPTEVFYAKLANWEQMTKELAQLKQREILLRKELFGECFPEPEEGTNYYPLQGGWKVRGRYKLERSIEVAQLGNMREALASQYGVSIDPLLNWKVDLKLTAYKLLSAGAKALFDNIVTTKPGSPQLDIIPPIDKDDPSEEEPTIKEVVEKIDVETGEVTVVEMPKKKPTTRKKKAVTVKRVKAEEESDD